MAIYTREALLQEATRLIYGVRDHADVLPYDVACKILEMAEAHPSLLEKRPHAGSKGDQNG